MKKLVLLIVYSSFGLSLSNAQRPLTIGDTLPAMYLENIINYNKSSVNTMDFRGQVLLLDFGATTCLPCLKAIPLLDSLKQQFGNKLQVFMITREHKDKVKRFFETNKIARKSSLAVITGDTVLNNYFPHTALPHEVWINADGIVAGITGHEYLGAENISKIINKIPVNWPVKADTGSLTTGSNTGVQDMIKPLYTTSFFRYRQGYKTTSQQRMDTANSKYILKVVNFTIPDLYKIVLGINIQEFFDKQLIVDPSLQQRFFYTAAWGYKAEWERQHKYGYEAELPLMAMSSQRSSMLREELDSYLNIRSVFEKRYIDCWVLTKKDPFVKANRKAGAAQSSLRSILSYYNNNKNFLLIVNETGYPDIALNKLFINIEKKDFNNEVMLMKSLMDAGISLSKEKRYIQILEFKPIKESNK